MPRCSLVDLWRPASRGDAYVGASRVRTAAGLYDFGSLRRSDWLPVGGPVAPIEQGERSVLSEDDEEHDQADQGSDDDVFTAVIEGADDPYSGDEARADYDVDDGASTSESDEEYYRADHGSDDDLLTAVAEGDAEPMDVSALLGRTFVRGPSGIS